MSGRGQSPRSKLNVGKGGTNVVEPAFSGNSARVHNKSNPPRHSSAGTITSTHRPTTASETSQWELANRHRRINRQHAGCTFYASHRRLQHPTRTLSRSSTSSLDLRGTHYLLKRISTYQNSKGLSKVMRTGLSICWYGIARIK